MIKVISSHQLSDQVKEKLQAKLSKKFDSNSFEYLIDKNLALGLLIVFENREYYYNLQFEVSHILQKLIS
jgi:F0F1-type ATP synthase delta subunit